SSTILLQLAVIEALRLERAAELFKVRRFAKFHSNHRAAAEIDAVARSVVDNQGNNPCKAEQERQSDEVPLLADPIDTRIAKKFHLTSKPQQGTPSIPPASSDLLLLTPRAAKSSLARPLCPAKTSNTQLRLPRRAGEHVVEHYARDEHPGKNIC